MTSSRLQHRVKLGITRFSELGARPQYVGIHRPLSFYPECSSLRCEVHAGKFKEPVPICFGNLVTF